MQLYVPAARGEHIEVFCYHYKDPIPEHLGAKCTLELVARKYYWPRIAGKVKAYSWSCSTSQCMRPVQHRPQRSIVLLPQLCGPWTDISVDFVVGLPVGHRKRHAKPNNAILVIVDQYIKQARNLPLPRYTRCCRASQDCHHEARTTRCWLTLERCSQSRAPVHLKVLGSLLPSPVHQSMP
jgi:hypothetical protein